MSINLAKPLRLRNDGGPQLELERGGIVRGLTVLSSGTLELGSATKITGATTLDSTLTVAGDANFDSGTLFVDVSADRVGIGTTNPATSLHIFGDARISRTSSVSQTRSLTLGGARNGLTADIPFAQIDFLNYDANGSSIDYTAARVWAGCPSSPNDAGYLAFSTAIDSTTLSEHMRITSSGDVGIGTTSPATTLDVNGDVTITDKIIHSGDTNTAIRFPSADTVTVETAGTERMRITSGGDLLLGKTSTSVSVSGAVVLNTGAVGSSIATGNDTFFVYNTTAAAYRFYVTDAGTVFATNTTISAISDRRFKENIRDLDAGLDKIMALKPRLYDWKAGKGADIKNARGFIAQEFGQVFPDLIDEWKDPAPEGEEPYKSVRQDLIPVLVKAIQELKAELDAAKVKIAALEAK